MKYKIVNGLDDIIINNGGEDFLNMPLYHGTRMHMLEMTEEERNNHFKKCHALLKYVQKNSEVIFDSIGDNIYSITYYWASIMQYGQSSLYEYGSFYMAFDQKCAKNYCNNIGGELGQLAYECAKILQNVNFDIEEEINSAIKYIVNFYNTYKDDKKVILVLPNVKIDDLENQRGYKYSKKMLAALDLDGWKEDLNDPHMTLNFSFRIVNYSDYEYYAIIAEN